MSFAGRAQTASANCYSDVVSSKASALADLRDEVSRLRIENKQFARQLHVDRYISKNRAQRMLNDLRADNIQLQRDNVAVKYSVAVLDGQAEVRENTVILKKKETEQELETTGILQTKIRDLESSIRLIEKNNQEKISMIRNTRKIEEETVNKTKSINYERGEENELIEEFEKAIYKTNSDLKKMQNRHETRVKESKKAKNLNEQLKRETLQIKKQNDVQLELLKRNEEEIEKLEADCQKKEDQYNFMKDKEAFDAKKHSAMLHVLHGQPETSSSVQTDPFIDGDSTNVFDKNGKSCGNYERGSIVRVMGIGGNTKRMFGKDLEVRATNYSRLVNLNVKLNK